MAKSRGNRILLVGADRIKYCILFHGWVNHMSSKYQKAYFLLSAADVKQLPPDEGIEVAIVGRSNAGKSSVLNRITQNKGLARVSKTPGRTQLLNVFVV